MTMMTTPTLQRWGARMRDRARTETFLRFVGRRFWDDNLFESAGALAFTTAFALVPLAMVAFSVLLAFPSFRGLVESLNDYIFSNFVPAAADEVRVQLMGFVSKAETLTVTGVVALVISLLVTLTSVEGTFNRIWRVPTARPKLGRFLVYWTVLTLGALIAAASLSLSARFFALSIFESASGQRLEMLMLRLAPMLIELLAFAALYRVVPHRTVKWRHAFAGALLAVVLFETIKWGLGIYFANFDSYQKIYGTIASIPILLFYIYLAWVAVLFGASFASALSSYRYQPAAMRLPEGYEIYGLLRMLGQLDLARREGRGLLTDQLLEREPMLTDGLVQELLAELDAVDIVVRAESGEWLLSRDLDAVTLAELYEACQLRIPVSEAVLPGRDDLLGVQVSAAIDTLRLPLRDVLRRKVGSLYEDIPA